MLWLVHLSKERIAEIYSGLLLRNYILFRQDVLGLLLLSGRQTKRESMVNRYLCRNDESMMMSFDAFSG